ncbi:hypothetical protein EUX98_g1606 [Antrodiella citrinella]|uniref:J domain-containing protein n=1 Tax=Antrodiella citrinella TaxID=2447956 RepID=A0A4S4N123_9APHY|nr:hypothetical protein EUX98_g1606 [Antrodiella citrinella]
MTSYFVFPPHTGKTAPVRIPFAFTLNTPTRLPPPSTSTDAPKPYDDQAKLKAQQASAEERRRRDAEMHSAQLQRERAEAWEGELAWVRSGGVIRDKRGKRDTARTEVLRAEVRLQDEEQRLLKRWNAYETRWRLLVLSSVDSDKVVRWEDMPWPMQTAPRSLDDLTPEAVEEFVFAPLRVRGCTVSRKERLRSSILKWHPDKVAVVLNRVVADQQALVREGVVTVFRILKSLQDADKGVPS